jgi:hypothetical protein
LVLPTQPTLWIFAIVVSFIGGWQLAKGFKRVNLFLLIVALIFVFAFLTWAARGESMNLLGMFSAAASGAHCLWRVERHFVRAGRGGQHRHRGYDAQRRNGLGGGFQHPSQSRCS